MILWDDREPVIIPLRRIVKGESTAMPTVFFGGAAACIMQRAYRTALDQPLHKPFGFHSRSGVVGGLPESCRMSTSALR